MERRRPTSDYCGFCCGENFPLRLREEDFVLRPSHDSRIPYHWESRDGRYDINFFWERGHDPEVRGSIWGQASGKDPDFEEGYPVIIGQFQIRWPYANTLLPPWSAPYVLRRVLAHIGHGDYCLDRSFVPAGEAWPPPPRVGDRTQIGIDLDAKGGPAVSYVSVR